VENPAHTPPADRATFERLWDLFARHKGDRRVAIVLLEVGWRFSRVIGNRRHPHEIVDEDPDDEKALARSA